MKDYLTLWGGEQPNSDSRILQTPITVIGECFSASRSEFAKAELTAYPADNFDVVDSTSERSELEGLAIDWPDPLIFGLLDVLMRAEPSPLKNIRIVLQCVWYHDIDSTRNAFRMAGRDAGRRIIEASEAVLAG